MKTLKFFVINFQIAFERKKNIKAAWKDAFYITKLLKRSPKNENPFTKWKF